MTTFCLHGISHQPGTPDAAGRSQWCAECYPEPFPLVEEASDPLQLPTVERLSAGAPLRAMEP